MGKLVLIDGNAILHRAYHALPKTLTARSGEPINAVYGFVSMLLKIISDLKPTHIACCFDLKEPTFRHKEYKAYQAHRPEMDKELSGQFEKAKDVVRSFGIPIYEKAGFEADDVIGTLVFRAVGLLPFDYSTRKSKVKSQKLKADEVIIVTGDRDILQLVSDKVKVYLPVKGLSQAKLMDSRDVVEKMGVKPEQIVDYKALVGDPSDNYPGVKGIGPKTAEKLLKKFATFENIYKNLDKVDASTREKLEEYKEDADMSYKLAKIVTDVDIKPDWDDMDDWGVGRDETLNLFSEIGFRTLTKRVKKFGNGSASKISYKKDLNKKQVEQMVIRIAKLLKNKQYAIRGTASLVLQDLDMIADDVDVICDKKTALSCNKLFKDYLVRKVEFSRLEKFKSYFGEFNIDGIKVEIYGEWQINKTQNSELKTKNWSQKYNADPEQISYVKVRGKKIPVTKIETELSMFAAMGRWNAFHKIKKQLEDKNQQSLF